MMQGLDETKRVMYFEYDFAKEGGAVGAINLRGGKLPAGAIVTSGIIHVETAVLSGGAATIALSIEAANDTRAATAKASWSLNALLDVVEDGAAANMVRVTDLQNLVATVAVAALTAGKFTVALEYVITTE